MPPANISSYVPIDELYYTIPAFNLYHYGEIVHDVVPIANELRSKDMQPTNILENVVTFFSLSLFGNNYYGLRMASVFSAFFVFIFMFFVLKALLVDGDGNNTREQIWNKGRNRRAHLILYACMAYLLFDFSFLVAGRVAEPTIFRMLAMVLAIYITTLSFLQGPLINKWFSIFLGFAGMAAVVFVYIYNMFIFCALIVSVFLWARKRDLSNAVIQFIFFIFGSLMCLVVYQIIAVTAYQSSLYEVYQHLTLFGGRMTGDLSGFDMVVARLVNLMRVFLTNIFRFNTVLLYLFVLTLPIFIWEVALRRENAELFVLNLLVFLGAQSVIINDFPMRKQIILLPLVIIVIGVGFRYIAEYLQYLNFKPRGIINFRSYALFVLASSLVVATVYLVPSVSDEAVLRGFVGVSSLFVLMLVGVVSIGVLRYRVRICRSLALGLIALTFVSNLYMSFDYVFMNRTYCFRDSMKAMSTTINGQIVVGGCAYGFRLYNLSRPVLASYSHGERKEVYDQEFDRLLSEGVGTYSIAYITDIPGSAIGMDYMVQHGLRLVEQYELPDHLGSDVGLFQFKIQEMRNREVDPQE